VKKAVGITSTIFVYDAQGQMVAEYGNQTGGSGTSYLTADNLGTPRVITDENGVLKARHDYLPFGEELLGEVGGRTIGQGYVSDNASQKFTGKIRDGETGLDFFGARYYASPQGRFTSVDPIYITLERLIDPQRLNLYAYTRSGLINSRAKLSTWHDEKN
jgi:RHS repeat-associated protein